MSETVLFVDDEPNVLSAIKRMLFDESYETMFANSGTNALELLQSTPVQVIVSDMRMPIMNGVQFLKKAKVLQPNTIRMVLSGQADLSDIMDTINEAGIWRYINKPWNDNDLKITINNALDLFRSEQDRQKLLVELADKNEQLANINMVLEKKVRDRTKLINAQNRLLDLQVKGTDLPLFLKEACSVIAEISCTKTVFVYDKEGNVISGDGTTASQKYIEMLSNVSKSGTIYSDGALFSVPLVQADVVFGACLIDGVPENDTELRDAIQLNIVPIISIAEAQNKSINDAPSLISDIDTLIGTL